MSKREREGRERKGWWERGERERERESQTERERNAERDSEKQIQRNRLRQRERETEKEAETERYERGNSTVCEYEYLQHKSNYYTKFPTGSRKGYKCP